jgi:hypothetical protein
MQPVALVANLPISIGGWGVRETAVILLFGYIGVTANAALMLSLQLGVLSLLVALPGGITLVDSKGQKSSFGIRSPIICGRPRCAAD